MTTQHATMDNAHLARACAALSKRLPTGRLKLGLSAATFELVLGKGEALRRVLDDVGATVEWEIRTPAGRGEAEGSLAYGRLESAMFSATERGAADQRTVSVELFVAKPGEDENARIWEAKVATCNQLIGGAKGDPEAFGAFVSRSLVKMKGKQRTETVAEILRAIGDVLAEH